MTAAGCGHSGSSLRSGSSRVVGGVLTGSVIAVHNTWSCSTPVDLDLVRVQLDDTTRDAVHIGPGCTGTIRRLEILGDGAGLGPGGDGVKVHAGARDLRVLSGVINCGRAGPRKHQDAIQAMGGTSVVFNDVTSTGCANSFMFINTGKGRRGTPTGIRCVNCRAVSHNYSIFVGSSESSGATNGVFTSRVPPHVTPNAVSPLVAGNHWKSSGLPRRRRR
ncbi:MAG TPA: hypothetical protein VGU02_00205 [Gaiellaceae bacterium]|nr:hypothetical protein [Gaiellaceae bacterium]